MASPEAIRALARCCNISQDLESQTDSVRIASRDQTFISLVPTQPSMLHSIPHSEDDVHTPILYQNLRKHCVHLHRTALSRLHLQMALYVHPVVRGDELVISQRAKSVTPQSRHLAEAELRSVYTMFIKAMISPATTGCEKVDAVLFKKLGNIMHVTSRELDRYSGQLRQFIVDDKGLYPPFIYLRDRLVIVFLNPLCHFRSQELFSSPPLDFEALHFQTCKYTTFRDRFFPTPKGRSKLICFVLSGLQTTRYQPHLIYTKH